MIKMSSPFVFVNKHVNNIQFAILELTKTFSYTCLPHAYRLDLRSKKLYSSIVLIYEFIVMTSSFIFYIDLSLHFYFLKLVPLHRFFKIQYIYYIEYAYSFKSFVTIR